MDPERPIEKLLRGYARKRRDEFGSPQPLHPATRRILQAEVDRRFPKAREQDLPNPGWLSRFWPRIAWGLGTCVVLALAVLILLPNLGPHGRSDKLLATNRDLEEGGLGDNRIPQQSLPKTEDDRPQKVNRSLELSQALSSKLTRSEKSQVQADGQQSQPVPSPLSLGAPAALAPSTPTLSQRSAAIAGQPGESPVRQVDLPRLEAAPAQAAADKGALLRRYGLTATQSLLPQLSEVQPTTPVAAPVSALGSFQPAAVAVQHTRTSQNYMTQRFRQVVDQTSSPAFAKQAKLDNAVLNSFEVVQSGPEVRIVDEDGSVYTGTLQQADAAIKPSFRAPNGTAAGRAFLQSNPAGTSQDTLADRQQLALQNYSFRVAGTNVTLKQFVVFTGNLTGLTNAVATASNANALGIPAAGTGVAQVQNAPVFFNILPSPESHISGKLKVGDTREVELNAVPAKP